MKNIWEQAKAAIKEHIPGYRYRMWVEPLDFKEEKEGMVILSCPNLFTRKRVLGYYESLIDSELKRIGGKDCNFLIEVLEKKLQKKTCSEEEEEEKKIGKSGRSSDESPGHPAIRRAFFTKGVYI